MPRPSPSARDVATALARLGGSAARWAYDTARDPRTHDAVRRVVGEVSRAFESTSVSADERLRASIAAHGADEAGGVLLRADVPLLRELRAHVKALPIHGKVKLLNALGLSAHNVLVVLGEGRDVEAYLVARRDGTHAFDRKRVCTICGLPRHAAPEACQPL